VKVLNGLLLLFGLLRFVSLPDDSLSENFQKLVRIRIEFLPVFLTWDNAVMSDPGGKRRSTAAKSAPWVRRCRGPPLAIDAKAIAPSIAMLS
jgi:hypothetical protein